jgi:hypothetical protein
MVRCRFVDRRIYMPLCIILLCRSSRVPHRKGRQPTREAKMPPFSESVEMRHPYFSGRPKMPLLQMRAQDGESRWIYAMPFRTLAGARSFVDHSLIRFKILSEDNRFIVVHFADAPWAMHCGYRDVENGETAADGTRPD